MIFFNRKRKQLEISDIKEIKKCKQTSLLRINAGKDFIVITKNKNINGYNIQNHSSFGNSIGFNDYSELTITGHFSNINLGDIISSKMQSGKTGMYEVIKIKYMSDPSDQFFGTVRELGYMEDIK